MFCLPSIDTERAKFLAKLYFGSYTSYEDFEGDINKYKMDIGSQDAKKLAEKYFKNYTGYRKFSKKLYELQKYHREDNDDMVKKYFQSIKEYRDFAEEIRNFPNSVLPKEAKKLSGKNFRCMKGLGHFWNKLCSLPYIDRERAKMIAKKHFGSNKSYEDFEKEMQNYPYSIKKKEALELVGRHFKERERYRDLLNDLDNEDIDKERAK
ncbi:uncharacterized protein LOC106881217 [Octopus bimaculoides]|uniref:uncharacterized protein LOC106881217 n=1 Tax=Octopus bimaculoides TaxID=37653 RepID=UPI0022E6FF5A|nr:uncharacterized protein LOC106881217 [Octopus bimaculoides]